ncbi:STE20-related kinase adapter protein alpha-like [Actinia tenebrosa]|uniref:STE20-related kinase adapter protein alpha-like n=1 Tax=Actinia tenebrosa TaxID=6105 RepID=A0A6P8I5B7_ACTTE|nr:STE20-related kinase adapter protein alpha-like [Actinia tenebrosa]
MSHLCACVDKANIAVAPATPEPQDSAEQQLNMSSDHLGSGILVPFLDCKPDPHDYRITTTIGHGFDGLAKISVSLHKPSSTFIVVKQTDVDFQSSQQLEDLKHEVQVLRSLNHPNILPLFSAFIDRQELWTVFPLMSYGSCSDILSGSFPEGMPEVLISCILREVFQGLDYLQRMHIIHRGIKGGHVLIGSDGTVCLSGFRNSVKLDPYTNTSGVAFDVPLHAIDVLPWMAPEILQQDLQGYTYTADVYSVGILAIELGQGTAPYTGQPPTKVLLEKLQNPSPRLCNTRLDGSDGSTISTTTDSTTMVSTSDSKEATTSKSPKKFSSTFHQIVDICVQKNPSSRPQAQALLGQSFFKQIKKKTREVIPEYLSSVPLITHRQGNNSSDEQDLESLSAANSIAALSLDEWVF